MGGEVKVGDVVGLDFGGEEFYVDGGCWVVEEGDGVVYLEGGCGVREGGYVCFEDEVRDLRVLGGFWVVLGYFLVEGEV